MSHRFMSHRFMSHRFMSHRFMSHRFMSHGGTLIFCARSELGRINNVPIPYFRSPYFRFHVGSMAARPSLDRTAVEQEYAMTTIIEMAAGVPQTGGSEKRSWNQG